MIGPFTVDTIFPGFPAVQREFAVDAVGGGDEQRVAIGNARQQRIPLPVFVFLVGVDLEVRGQPLENFGEHLAGDQESGSRVHPADYSDQPLMSKTWRRYCR